MLAKGLVITGDRLQAAVDELVARGRLTRQDAEDLVQNLVEISRRQTQDTLAEIEGIVGRSAMETRRATRSRARIVGAAVRRAPGSDRAIRTVDIVRRATGRSQALAIADYDDLTSAQVKGRLADLDHAELRRLRDHERANANRKSVLSAIDRLLE